MININEIYNEDCFDTMGKMDKGMVDVVLTSPFYNTNKKQGSSRTLLNTKVKKTNYEYIRYDMHIDNLTDEEYDDFTVKLFNEFDNILKPNGVVLYNISYGGENTTGMFTAINAILMRTNMTIADVITWKKSNAMPNSSSPNKLTRITEFVFVLCRKDEFKTFNSNKRVTSTRPTGQKMYENVYNYIEAKNNDGKCPYNKATYSSDLCLQLLNMYCDTNEDVVVYDPFMGSGTTAVACVEYGVNYVGSEISDNQVRFAEERINSLLK